MKSIFSVSQLNSYIHRIFDSDYALRKIYIKGEISNCKYHSSGHIYFTLKDERSILSCIMYAGDRRRGLNFRLENGQQVIAGGNVTVYEKDGRYQLHATEIELSGAGLIFQRLQQLKKELNSLGYFDPARKKPMPAYPRKIGIVTSVTGAVIEDIKSVTRRRNPFVQLYLRNSKVQGDGAGATIAAGIEFFDHFGVDLIIIGRGGGSNEDLWAFNERCVADAIYHANTPVVAATGHQVDLTIADYCADLRAETPSAACELVIPDVYALLQTLDRYQDSLDSVLQHRFDSIRRQIEVYGRLLESNHPRARLLAQKDKLEHYEEKLHSSIHQQILAKQHALDFYAEKLTALSPSMRLRGGYVFAQKSDESPVSSASDLMEGEEFSLIFQDGQALVRTLEIHNKQE